MRVSRQPCKSSWRPAPAAEANVERLRRLARDELGSVLVETALIFPTLMLLTFGLITLGFITNNYISLTSATSAAARQFALDAPVSTTSISTTPYTDLKTQLKTSAGLLATPQQERGAGLDRRHRAFFSLRLFGEFDLRRKYMQFRCKLQYLAGEQSERHCDR